MSTSDKVHRTQAVKRSVPFPFMKHPIQNLRASASGIIIHQRRSTRHIRFRDLTETLAADLAHTPDRTKQIAWNPTPVLPVNFRFPAVS